MLVKNALIDVVKATYQVSFDFVVRIILQSNDHSEMQNATQCLATLVAGGKQDMLAWCGDLGFKMRILLDVASSLPVLSPETSNATSDNPKIELEFLKIYGVLDAHLLKWLLERLLGANSITRLLLFFSRNNQISSTNT